MGKDINGKELGKGITQRNDGRYNARVTINGVKINLYDYNLSLLKKNLEAKKLKVLRDDYSTRPNISLNQWYKDEWFPVYKLPYLKDEVNRHNYIVRYENAFGRLLGNRRISCITEILIQKAANSLIDDFGYSTKFIRESVSSLKEAFNAAVTNHLISRNPSSNIVVKNDNLVSERVVMTDEQQMQFLNIAKYRYYSEVYQILLFTGMRIGELTALQWDDIDFENKEIHIRHSMQSAYLNGKKILNMTTPKTSNSIRDIPMFDGVEKLFVSWKEKQDKAKKELGRQWRLPKEFENLVFTSSLGSPLTRYVLSNDINKIVSILDKNEEYLAELENRKPQKFPKIHPHSFRHTFATRCFEKNLKPVFIMSIMGHSNYETTLSYTHLLKKSNDQQISLAGSFISSRFQLYPVHPLVPACPVPTVAF